MPICPELEAGFSTPRPLAEIQNARSGDTVPSRQTDVVENAARNVIALYEQGARSDLATTLRHGGRLA